MLKQKINNGGISTKQRLLVCHALVDHFKDVSLMIVLSILKKTHINCGYSLEVNW